MVATMQRDQLIHWLTRNGASLEVVQKCTTPQLQEWVRMMQQLARTRQATAQKFSERPGTAPVVATGNWWR